MVRTVDPITERKFDNGGAWNLDCDPDNTERHREFDPLFKAPLSIDIEHHEIHEGDAFFRRLYDEDAANNELIQIYMLSPAVSSPQKRAHLVFSHDATGEHTWRIIEGVTLSAGGSDVSPFNRHRGSAKTTAMQAFKVGSDKAGDTITYTGGTEIDGFRTGSGRNLGGGSRGVNEWILAPATTYLFEIQSHAVGIALAMGVDWYEHTDG